MWRRFLAWLARSTLSNPQQWLVDYFGGGTQPIEGIRIDEQTALNVTTVLSAVKILAESVASLPLLVYERLERGKRRAPEHPLYRVLHLRPNPTMTSFSFRELAMRHLLTYGNFYAEIVYGGQGEVAALWPLRPETVRVEGTVRQPLYRCQANGQEIVLPADRILHIRGLSVEGVVGMSPVRLCRAAIALARAAEEFGCRFFAGDSMPRIALKHPGALGPEAVARIAESWKSAYSGMSGSNRVAILDGGLDVVKLGIDPEAAQMLGAREFQVREIARIFNIPPHFLGDLQKASYASVEQEALRFVIYTLRPWLVRIEQEINSTLFSAQEQDRYYAEHLVDALLRADTRSRYEAYARAIQWGWMSRNEVRELENLSAHPALDDYLVPLNMAVVSGGGDASNQQP